MATPTLHRLVLGAFSSVSEASGRPRSSRRYSYPKLRCRRLEVISTESRDCHDLNLSPSCGRRSLTFKAAIPFLLPLHHLADVWEKLPWLKFRPFPELQFIVLAHVGAAPMAKAFPFKFPRNRVVAAESSIIQSEVMKVLSKSKAAGMLRLAFHDAGTFDTYDSSGGMNGSIVYELDRPENVNLSKSIKTLEKAKRETNKIQQVSWADLIAVAGAEAVSLCGGPAIPLRLGRLDARMPDPEGKLPQESLDASGLKRCFLRKGFSTQELVALSGAHTLGSKGFGSPNVFDNSYFRILLEKPWTSSASMSKMIGLPSDRALVEDDECSRWIKIYADDESTFFKDFRSSYIKLVNSGVHWR